jgi:uncharacterized protein YbaR (Trm112 family)
MQAAEGGASGVGREPRFVCPESHQPLRPAGRELLDRLEGERQHGLLRNRAGETVTAPFDDGLLREDGAVLYPVRDGIPILLIEESIEVARLGSGR